MGRVAKVGYNHRFHPAVLKAREIVDHRELGQLMFIRGRYGHGGRPSYEKEWRFERSISGGGELIDQGSHLTDLADRFLGEFTEVHAGLRTFYWNVEVEDNCFSLCPGPKGGSHGCTRLGPNGRTCSLLRSMAAITSSRLVDLAAPMGSKA
jgi:predicted dehydrogenase